MKSNFFLIKSIHPIVRRTLATPAKSHSERRLLKFSCEQLYAVVSDVDSYSKFVPWCKDSRVLSIKPTGMEAELVVGFGLFEERYISEVSLDKPNSIVAISKQTSLLEFLKTEWKFTPSSQQGSSWVHFHIEFKFKSAMYHQLSNAFFSEIVDNMINAFESRCHHTYNDSKHR